MNFSEVFFGQKDFISRKLFQKYSLSFFPSFKLKFEAFDGILTILIYDLKFNTRGDCNPIAKSLLVF